MSLSCAANYKGVIMLYITNAFSLNMVPSGNNTIVLEDLTIEQVKMLVAAHEEAWGYLGYKALASEVVSGVGHPDTAAVFSSLLDLNVPMNRINISLKNNDVLIVGQYSGPRLPEGATTLPEGASIRWMKVTIE